MSHTNDRARRLLRRQITGEPVGFVGPSDNLSVLDTPDVGQSRLQALLFQCLTGLQDSRSDGNDRNPWDPRRRRRLNDLRLYVNWVAPRRKQIHVCCNSPEKVASQLLPHALAEPAASASTLKGIPGLRLAAQQRSGGIVLRHVPTGGSLRLADSRGSSSPAYLREELDWLRRGKREEDWQYLGDHGVPVRADERESADQAVFCHPPLAALMARFSIFIFTPPAMIEKARRVPSVRWAVHDLRLMRAPDNSAVVAWSGGPSAAAVVELLVEGPLPHPGARLELAGDDPIVSVDGVRLQLRRTEMRRTAQPPRRTHSQS